MSTELFRTNRIAGKKIISKNAQEQKNPVKLFSVIVNET